MFSFQILAVVKQLWESCKWKLYFTILYLSTTPATSESHQNENGHGFMSNHLLPTSLSTCSPPSLALRSAHVNHQYQFQALHLLAQGLYYGLGGVCSQLHWSDVRNPHQRWPKLTVGAQLSGSKQLELLDSKRPLQMEKILPLMPTGGIEISALRLKKRQQQKATISAIIKFDSKI